MAIHRNQIGEIGPDVSEFHKAVVQGLSSSPKFLQSKYFYDAKGDKLFQEIMNLPEYYLTRSEMEIFSTQTQSFENLIKQQFGEFDVLELGAGDATKSTHLLRQLQQAGHNFTYYPVDISKNTIAFLQDEMPKRIPGIQIHGLNGEYMEMIGKCYEISHRRKLILFLGSTIGNFSKENAQRFLKELNNHLKSGDLVLIGFDLKKNPKQILAAYNDSAKVTKSFNLNILKRVNRELKGNFDLSKFDHYPTYDPITGTCKSYLISLEKQEIQIGNEAFQFYKNEPIWTELSQKYSEGEIAELARNIGFVPLNNFFDGNRGFMDVVWKK